MTTWILRLLLVVLPVFIALYWIKLKRSGSEDDGTLRRKELGLIGLSAAAFIGVLLFIVFLAPSNGGKPGDVYIAPFEKDGKIIPGEFLSPEEAAARGLAERSSVDRKDETLETFGD